MRIIFSFSFLLCLICLTGLCKAAEKFGFPETKTKIAIFADQLPPHLSEAQIKFAATHYVGSQKLTLNTIKRLRKYNPGFVVLHYHLALWQQQPKHHFIIDGKHWGNDWPLVNKHESWFWHNAKGQRVRSKIDGKYLMNISDRGFRKYWKTSIARQILAGQYQGVFLDSASPALLPWEAAPADPRLAGKAVIKRPFKELGGLTWRRAYENFMRELTSFLEFLGFATLPNIGALFTTWDTTDYYTTASGAFMEGAFDTKSIKDWQMAVARTLRLIRNDKIVIFQSYLHDPYDYQKRIYYLSCYLLLKGRYTYLFYFAGPIFSWYPEWDLDLGEYKKPVHNLQELQVKPGLYCRKYQKGEVWLNIGHKRRSIYFKKPLYWVKVKGGGPVDKRGNIAGKIITTQTPKIVLPPWSGAVLLYHPPEALQSKPL